jgi:hypothetical protein
MRLKVLAAAALSVGFVQSSFGTTLGSGSFDFVGTIFVTATAGVITPAGSCPFVGCIFWQSISTASNGMVDITSQSLVPSTPSLVGNDNANISSLANPATEPVGALFGPVPFMSFVTTTGVTTVLDINYISNGIYPSAQCNLAPAIGQICTLAGSEFNLMNVADLSSTCCTAIATWQFSGVTNTPGQAWVANFTAMFPGIPYQTVLNEALTLGYVSIPFTDDGEITLTQTPEPGSLSLLMIATGLGVVALSLRHRAAK